MKKQTLLFKSLPDLCTFSKSLSTGFLLNTKNLTITGTFSILQINMAIEMYKAKQIETTEKVYSYDALM